MTTVKSQILEEILDNSFSIEGYQRFVREFFNGPDMLPVKRSTGIWREYENHIMAYYQIADYKDVNDKNILILAVELKSGKSVQNARSIQRNFISKILDINNKGAAIVAFYSPEDPSWRLSFVRLDYSFTAKGIELDLTPSKRYSFLVGKNEPKHTALTQLLKIFEDDIKNPSLDEIEEAFSIETVTKDFFNAYRDKYLDLKLYLESNEQFIKETNRLGFELTKFSEQFSKKLMGQLAFLFFLQKKGWLGVRLLPENRTITQVEYEEIYNSVGDANKKVLNKVFKQLANGNMKASSDDLHSIDDHEAELLSDCFIHTKHDMPWGSGEREFIWGLFEFCTKQTKHNFFNYYLEPFFYEALNRKRKNHYYKLFNCKIPFLNGGLFEPLEGYHWRDVKFEIPNYIFSNFAEKGRDADGILDVFNRFNFTINEDEPLEKEVAIDPEMLGKIFENLLDVKDRKSKGAFYTPREIVHYMCQESLINYLVNKVSVPYEDMKEFILYGELIKDADNRRGAGYSKELKIKNSILDNIVAIDNALENVKVADPAVGSGAFPLGMLNEIVKARDNITEYIIKKNREGAFRERFDESFIRSRRSKYKMKLKTIQNSIFAVDIEPSAVDIAKLRLWLSVVVEQEIDANNTEPHPLPNLDQNIMVGNSLIDEYEGIKLFDKSILYKNKDKDKSPTDFAIQMNMLLDESENIMDDMFDLQDRYFNEDNDEVKKDIKKKIDMSRHELIRYKLSREGNTEGLKKYEESLKNKTKPYFIWELEFAKVFKDNGGFDIVVGNPPYVQLQKNEGYLANLYENLGFETFTRSGDIYMLFYEIGLNITKDKGIVSYITSNKWLRANYGASLRKFLIKYNTKLLIDLGPNVFENATVDTNILVIEKNKYNNTTKSCRLEKTISNIHSYVDNKCIERSYSEDMWIVLNDLERKIKNKIEEIAVPISSWNVKINFGIKTGFNKAFLIDRNIREELIRKDPKATYIIKPVLRGRDIIRYGHHFADVWLINVHNGLKKEKLDSIDINDYPSVKEHLNQYYDEIKKRKDQGDTLYNLRNCAYFMEFNNPKILYSEIVREPQFYLDKKGDYYPEATTFMITGERLEYLYAALHSKACTFLFKNYYAGGGLGTEGYRYKKVFLEKLPIPQINDELNDIFIDLVNKIETSKVEGMDTQRYENRIDDLMYELYQLTNEEISYIKDYID